MKDQKIPIGWLIPIAVSILLIGWYLGHSGWNVTEINPVFVKLSPPTATPLAGQTQAEIQQATAGFDAASTAVPQNPISRPSRFNIRIGDNHSIPPGDWTWVCTGDFSITLKDGSKKALYDIGISNTGLTLILQPNSSISLDGPFDMSQGTIVGDCYPYAQDEKDSAVSAAVEAHLNTGCGSRCQFVNVIELDKDGNETENYWLPQQP
jgi:hypothetical protein